MTNYLKPPKIPHYFKRIGLILTIITIICFITTAVLSDGYENIEEYTFGILNKHLLITFRLIVIISLCMIIFSKEKSDDERLLQFKMIQLSRGVLYFSLMVFMGLIFSFHTEELYFYQDPGLIAIVTLTFIIAQFYIYKKDF